MTFRLSLRKKLVYTFLGGSLLTVLLFSIVIKGIMNDYFQRLAEVRLQFVSEQGQREIRTNVAIFKNHWCVIARHVQQPLRDTAASFPIVSLGPKSINRPCARFMAWG